MTFAHPSADTYDFCILRMCPLDTECIYHAPFLLDTPKPLRR